MKHYLETVKWGVIPIINYRGLSIMKVKNGFKVLGKTVPSPEEVDRAIEEAGRALSKSIK